MSWVRTLVCAWVCSCLSLFCGQFLAAQGSANVSQAPIFEDGEAARFEGLSRDQARIELMHLLSRVSESGDASKAIALALHSSHELDREMADSLRDGTSTQLATRFAELLPSAFPAEEFHEEFGLVEESSEELIWDVEVLVQVLSDFSSQKPGSLLKLLSEEASNPTQEESDLVVYAMACEFIMEYQSVYQSSGYGEIIALRDSENPIYRLLALKVMPFLEKDGEALASFVEPYLKEEDELIQRMMIEGLRISESEKAVGILQQIASESERRPPQVIDEAKRTLARAAQP